MRVDTRPFRHGAFRRLWSAEIVNIVGDWVGDIALAILVFDQTGSALATALLFIAMRFLPALAAPPFATRIEALPARWSLPLIYAVEAGLFILLAILADNFILPLVALIAFFDGTLAMSGRTLIRSSAASILKPRGELRAGNSLLNLAFTWGSVFAPLIGGVLVATVGVRDALLIDAGTFLVAAVVLMNVEGLPDAEPDAVSWRERLGEGLDYVKNHDVLLTLLTTLGVLVMFTDLVLPLEVIFVKETLDAGNVGYGIFIAAWGVGMAIGGLWFAVTKTKRLHVLLLASVVLIAVAYIGTAFAPDIYIASAIQVVGGFGNGFQWVALITLIQEMIDDRFQVRVISILESVDTFMPGVGFILGGMVGSVFSVRVGFAVAGVGVLLTLAAAFKKLRAVPWPETMLSPTDDLDIKSVSGKHIAGTEQEVIPEEEELQ